MLSESERERGNVWICTRMWVVRRVIMPERGRVPWEIYGMAAAHIRFLCLIRALWDISDERRTAQARVEISEDRPFSFSSPLSVLYSIDVRDLIKSFSAVCQLFLHCQRRGVYIVCFLFVYRI